MATNILMPALSPTMTEGTLARWLKKEGDVIRAGDVIAEIETDKATMEVEAVDEGVLGKILVADGTEGVQVNAPIAVLVEPGEALPTAPAVKPIAVKPMLAPPAPQVRASEVPAAAIVAPPTHSTGDRVFVSPLARRMAKQAGLDLAAIPGSGPNGRIVRADIDTALAGGTKPAAAVAPAAAPAVAAKAPTPLFTAPHTVVPHSSMRKVIARRLSESKSTIPHFYVAMDIEIDALLALGTDLTARGPKDVPGGFRITVNDLIIKAVAVALRRHPKVNASWTDEAMVMYDDVDISVAVAIADGLITPIIRRADQKGLATISAEMRDLATRAKAGKLKPEEFQGGGFSISNMGMFGVSGFSAIINPPQAAILAVASGQKRPVVKDGALAVATVMTCTLSADHRVIDGALGAAFMAELKRIIEDPLSLML